MGARWNHFWFEKRSSRVLSLVRLAFGATLVMRLMGTWGIYKGMKGLRFMFPHPDTWHYGRAPLPWPGFEWLPTPDKAEFIEIKLVLLVLAFCFTAGFATRIVGPLIWLALVFFLGGSQWNYLHHINAFAWVMTILAFSPCADHYSVDALIRRGVNRYRGRPDVAPRRVVMPLRMIQLFVSLLYLSTTIGKLNDGWFSGAIMERLQKGGWLKGPWVPTITSLIPAKVMAWFTLFAEGLLAFGLWVPKLRWFTAITGIALHLGIDSMMNVSTFSYQMIALYLAFLEPVWTPREAPAAAAASGEAL